MTEYNNHSFDIVINKIRNNKEVIVNVESLDKDYSLHLQYFLTRNFYYAVIVDDYPIRITSKELFLEALYYQVRLITVHNLNWDAIEEGLVDVLHSFMEFEGVCLLFRHGEYLEDAVGSELKMLSDIIREINERENKKIKIILTIPSVSV